MIGADPRDIDQIAEYADSSVRAIVAAPRAGSLPGIEGRRGLNAWLYKHYGNGGNAIYTFIGSLLTIAVSGLAAWVTNEPLVFPSLGATAFLIFETPMAEVASPRNTVIGHLVGGAVALLWLVVFGLRDDGSAIANGITGERVVAIALSLAFTGGILRLLRAAHPPAGATTIIVSIGLLTTWTDMLSLVCGVGIVVVLGGILNRLMGVPAPVWSPAFSGLRKAVGPPPVAAAGPARR